ncbi:hypothetical protein [Serratia marcescens]|uniref:hypothetical protein n=1 Tax=Serratia marcescens TaxID=615 RepID=UPI001F5B8FE7|nr:hypothetical protein [Serratia marcescens]
MVKADLGDALLFFEPSYLVRAGMEAFLVTRSSDRYFIDTLSELEGALKGGKPRALIMELYHQNEYLYDVLRFVLTAKNVWPELPLGDFHRGRTPRYISAVSDGCAHSYSGKGGTFALPA